MNELLNSCLLTFVILLTLGELQAQNSPWKRYLVAGNEAAQYGRDAEAEKWYRLALAEAEHFGEKDERLATSLRSVALVLKVEGMLTESADKLTEARQLFSRLLQITSRNHGANNREVGFVWMEIGEVFKTEGNLPEAEAAYKRNLIIQRINLERHDSKQNGYAYKHAVEELANIYCLQDRYKEARLIDTIVPDCVQGERQP